MYIDYLIKKFEESNRYLPLNGWVEFPGFDGLYVRVGPRIFLNLKRQDKVIDLANLTATHPGNGAFKRLVAHLRETFPEYGIFVENVLTAKFCAGLERMGFVSIDPENFLARSYWMEGANG